MKPQKKDQYIYTDFFPEEIAIWFSSQPLISGEAPASLASPVLWPLDIVLFVPFHIH